MCSREVICALSSDFSVHVFCGAGEFISAVLDSLPLIRLQIGARFDEHFFDLVSRHCDTARRLFKSAQAFDAEKKQQVMPSLSLLAPQPSPDGTGETRRNNHHGIPLFFIVVSIHCTRSRYFSSPPPVSRAFPSLDKRRPFHPAALSALHVRL